MPDRLPQQKELQLPQQPRICGDTDRGAWYVPQKLQVNFDLCHRLTERSYYKYKSFYKNFSPAVFDHI